jgi:hypothetical protein
LGDNAHAFTGGLRLWAQDEGNEKRKKSKKKRFSRGKILTRPRLRQTNSIL